jgi:hypothetical protein
MEEFSDQRFKAMPLIHRQIPDKARLCLGSPSNDLRYRDARSHVKNGETLILAADPRAYVGPDLKSFSVINDNIEWKEKMLLYLENTFLKPIVYVIKWEIVRSWVHH